MQSVTATMILGYTATRGSGNIVHPILGRPDPDVTLGQLGLRSGTLEVLVPSLSDALAVQSHLGIVGVHELTDPSSPEIGMSFVITDRVDVTLDDQTRAAATVRFGYQEVLA